MTGFDRACEIAGGVGKLADRMTEVSGERYSQSRLSNWKKTGVPSESIIHVALGVDWKVTPHEIDSSLYPNPDDALPPEVRDSRLAA